MIEEIVSNNLIPRNEFIFGFADLRGIIHEKYESYPFGISIGRRLDDKIVDEIFDGPTLDYFNLYHEINNELLETAKNIQSDLRDVGIKSIVIQPTIPTDSLEFQTYKKDLRVEVSQKMVATRAGLGWIGKTDLFISKQFGPRVRLASILINQPVIAKSVPIDKSRCGKCNICVEKCPAQASNGKLWNIDIYRDEFFNAFKCRDKCQELTLKKLGLDKRICGICISVCPIGKKNKTKTGELVI